MAMLIPTPSQGFLPHKYENYYIFYGSQKKKISLLFMRLNYLIQQFAQLLTTLPDTLQQSTVRQPIAISLGAIAGSLSRYYFGIWLGKFLGTNFPYGTVAINLTGCLGMGCFVTLASEKFATISPELRLLIAVGFLGSYTTFSTYELDTINLMSYDNLPMTILYWLGSATLGLFAVQLGVILGRLI